MRFIQSVCYMLLTMVALAIGAAFLVTSANTQTAVAAPACDATQGPCSVDQGINVTILPPGVPPPPPPTTTPPTPPPTTPPPVTTGPGTGKAPTVAGPTKLPKTGPKETAIMAVVGVIVLQVGLVFTVRAARSTRRMTA